MIHTSLSLSLALLFLACSRPIAYAQGTTHCRTPDALANALLAYTTGLATGTDSVSTARRDRYDLPNVTASDVSFVTDESVCLAAARAVATVEDSAVQPVQVIRVGTTRYVVTTLQASMGEFVAHLVFDSNWRLLKVWAS